MKQRLVLLALAPVGLALMAVALVRYFWSVLFAPARAFLLAISIDQLGNTALNGEPDETISSRAARARLEKRRWGCILCRLLDSLQANHCDRSLEPRFLKQTSTPKEVLP